MTYIEILNAFWNWRRFNIIPHSAADLFYCILDFANATGWEDKVTIPNSRIMGRIDISEKSLFNARNVLIRNDLIKYNNGKKGQAGTYEINVTTLYFFCNKGSNMGGNNGSNKGSNKGSNSGVIRGVYIDKDKDKTNINNINIICAEPKNSAPKNPPVITLTLNDKSEYEIFNENFIEWVGLYPAVDVMQELRNMKGWLNANPTRRKTKSGINRFITTWLSKEQNKGGAVATQKNKSSPNPFLDMLNNTETREEMI